MAIPTNNTDHICSSFSPAADELFEFALRYNDYIYRARDYGNGDPIKMVEVHTLAMIEEHPGISVSQLARLWQRTKGTVSVNVSALEKKGYIYRQKDPGNSKVMHLYPTAKGLRLSVYHRAQDQLDNARVQEELLKTCTQQDLDSFYKVLQAYLELL